MKPCVSLLSLGRDLCPSDLDKAQEIPGAKGLTDMPSPSPSLVLEGRQVAKIVQLGLSPSGWSLLVYAHISQHLESKDLSYRLTNCSVCRREGFKETSQNLPAPKGGLQES